MLDCIFCKIAKGEIKTDFLYESDKVVAFKDLHPLAPIHYLIIPKEHIASMNEMEKEQEPILGEMMLAAVKLAKEAGIDSGGYKLLIRTGHNGGQEVPHVHLHLIGGARLSEGIGKYMPSAD